MSETQEKAQEKESIELAPIGRDGDYLLGAIGEGRMIAMLCGGEMLYAFAERGEYHCCIHTLYSEQARRKAFPMTDESREMLKGMAGQAEQLFEIAFREGMDPFGVMYAAEEGILDVLRTIGRDPGRGEE